LLAVTVARRKASASARQARWQPRSHAPVDARHEPREARRRVWPDVPASPEIREGTNRISASRLQQSADILQVPVTFFVEGGPSVPAAPQAKGTAPSLAYVTDFL